MLPGTLAGGGLSPFPTGWPLLGSLSTRREALLHPHGTGQCEEGRGHASVREPPGARPLAHLSSLANTQMQESRHPQHPQHPKVSVPPPPRPSSPRRLRRGGWGGRLGEAGPGEAVWSVGRQHKAQVSFPGTASVWGLGLPPALRRRTFYQSGGCAGRGSWRRPCPESA